MIKNFLMCLFSFFFVFSSFSLDALTRWGDRVESKLDVINDGLADVSDGLDPLESLVDKADADLDAMNTSLVAKMDAIETDEDNVIARFPRYISSADIVGGVITLGRGLNVLMENVTAQINISFDGRSGDTSVFDLNGLSVTGRIIAITNIANGVFIQNGTLHVPSGTGISIPNNLSYKEIRDMVIECETVSSGAGGYGIVIGGDRFEINNCIVTGGSTTDSGQSGGAGIYVTGTSSGEVLIERCTVTGGDGGNATIGTAGRGGDGILLSPIVACIVSNCQISSGNGGDNSGGNGGNGGDGVRVVQSRHLIVNNTFKNIGSGGTGTGGTDGTDGRAIRRDGGAIIAVGNISDGTGSVIYDINGTGQEFGVPVTYPVKTESRNMWMNYYFQ